MALHQAYLETAAMNSKTKTIPSRAGVQEFTARKFSKARSIAERLGICLRWTPSIGQRIG